MQGHDKTFIPDDWSIEHWTYSTTREMGGSHWSVGRIEGKGKGRHEG